MPSLTGPAFPNLAAGTPPGWSPRLPKGHQAYVHQNKRYYGHGGVYYQPSGHGYVVARPPRGFYRRNLPISFSSLVVAGLTYYFLAGIFYRQASNGYVVVDAPAAPQGAAVVNVSRLNVRSGPDRSYPLMATVSQGFNLTVYGQSPGWLYVQAPNGQFGWVARRFTNIVAAKPPYG